MDRYLILISTERNMLSPCISCADGRRNVLSRSEGRCWRTVIPRFTPELDTVDVEQSSPLALSGSKWWFFTACLP
jgi:hypothetical protein